MKQNVKVFLVALLIGGIVGYLVCYQFDTPIFTNALGAKVTYFYTGSYNSLEEAQIKQKEYPNSIIYESDGIYQIVIGVYGKEEAITLMESYFLDQGITFRMKEIKVSSEYLKTSSNYELLIISGDPSYYANINGSLLTLFHEYKN